MTDNTARDARILKLYIQGKRKKGKVTIAKELKAEYPDITSGAVAGVLRRAKDAGEIPAMRDEPVEVTSEPQAVEEPPQVEPAAPPIPVPLPPDETAAPHAHALVLADRTPQQIRGASLDDLAGWINDGHEQVKDAYRRTLEHARCIGEMLLEVKKRTPHGQWRPWLTEHVGFSERSAQNYMRIAEHWEELLSKSAGTADLTIEGAVRLLASPPQMVEIVEVPRPPREPVEIEIFQVPCEPRPPQQIEIVQRGTAPAVPDDVEVEPSTPPEAVERQQGELFGAAPSSPSPYPSLPTAAPAPVEQPLTATDHAGEVVVTGQPFSLEVQRLLSQHAEALRAARARVDATLAGLSSAQDPAQAVLEMMWASEEEEDVLGEIREVGWVHGLGLPAEGVGVPSVGD